MTKRSTLGRFATPTLALTLIGAASVQAAPMDLTDFFNDGFIATDEWQRIAGLDMMGMPIVNASPIWQPFFGSDAALVSAVTAREDIRKGELQFNAAANRGTNSYNGYIASGWSFDPAEIGNPPGMMPPDPSMGMRFSGTGEMDMGIFRDDDPELEDRPASFMFSIDARFADRRPDRNLETGFRNGLVVSVTEDPMNLGFDSLIDQQFTTGGEGTGFEVFIENDGTPGLNIGLRAAGAIPGEMDMAMRLPQGEKFDGTIMVTYTNDNMAGGLNQVTVSFVTDEGPIFNATLTDVFRPAQQIQMDSDNELVIYGGIIRPVLFIGALSTQSGQDFNARQSYFDNFIMSSLTNLRDNVPMPDAPVTDLDMDGDTDAVDLAVALDAVVPLGDAQLLALIIAIDPQLNPLLYLKDRQYNRAIGRYYRRNVIPTFAGKRKGREKRADRRRLQGLRGVAQQLL